MSAVTVTPVARTAAIAAVGGFAALLHGLVALGAAIDNLGTVGSPDVQIARLFGFALLALVSLGTVVVVIRRPRLWLPALAVATLLLLLAFTDLRSVGLDSV